MKSAILLRRKPKPWITDKIDIHGKVLPVTWWVLAVAVFSLIVAIRIRLLGIPLERDEGEYAYAGQLMLQGIPPYKLAYNMKFPGTYAAYAVMMSIFGQTVTGIHLGLLLVNAATIILIFLIARHLLNSTAGIAAGATYAVLSVSPSVLGFAGHATHFVLLPVLGGAFLLLQDSDQLSKRRILTSGSLFGIGLLMKQPAFLFILFGAAYLWHRDRRARLGWGITAFHQGMFLCGVSLPLLAAAYILWSANVLPQFWFWTIKYAREYGSLLSVSDGLKILAPAIKRVIGFGWPLWALAGVGLGVCIADKEIRKTSLFILGLLVCSVAAVCSGFYFRLHYFVLILPALSLLVGVAIHKISTLLIRYSGALSLVNVLLLGAALSFPICGERDFFFSLPLAGACRVIYPESLFPESLIIAKYIREHTTKDDVIAVLGSEPQIYFYSQRHSATGYIYTYALMEPQKYAEGMQEEMIREIELAHPKYLISVVMNDSWLRWPGSNQGIFRWANEYASANYTVVGFVNILSEDRTDYYFDSVPQSIPSLRNYVLIYRRNS